MPPPTPIRLPGPMHRLGRLVRAVPAVVAVAGLLVGVPWLLVVLIGSPLPSLLHGWDRPLDDGTLLGLLAVLAWILWAIFARDLVAETILALADISDQRHGRTHHHRTRTGGPVRVVAAVLVGAIAGAVLVDLARTIATGTTHRTDAYAAPPATVAVALITPSTMDVHADRVVTAPAATVTAARHGHQPPAWAAGAPGGAYLVVEGDNEWDIAAAQLGDPYRWREIYVLSRHQLQPDGRTLTDPALIHPGWWLALPARTPAATPPNDPTPAAPAPDTDGADNQPPATGQPTPAPPATGAPSTAPAPGATAPAGTPALTPSPPSSPSAAPTGTLDPSSSAAPAASPSPAAPNASEQDAAAGEDAAGVVLPSQAWISAGLAALIASVAFLVRLHRRRSVRHTFPIPVGTSPEPSPVPPGLRLADVVGHRQLRAHPDPDTPVPSPPTVPAAIGTSTDQSEVSLFDLPGGGLALDGDGALSTARAILAAALSTGVLEWETQRPIVITTADTLTRLLPAGTLPIGLDPRNVTFDPERLVVLDDTAAAVTVVEEEVIHRRRLLDSLDANSIDEANAMPGHAEHQPGHVLLIQASPRHEPRLAAIAAHARTLRLCLVILGPTGSVPALMVDTSGAVTAPGDPDLSATAPPDVARLSTLAAPDLAAVLDLVRAAAPRPVAGFDIDDPTEPPTGRIAATAEVPPRSATPAPVWLTVLGPTTLTVNGTLLNTGIRSGSRAVLTVLTAHPKGRTLDEIAADLHPTIDPALAINRVKTDITGLRTPLRAASGLERSWFVVHDSATGRYRIEPDLIDVDLWKMIRAIEHANTFTDNDTACLTALREAVDYYSGDFAADDGGAWTIDYATTFRHQYLSALTRIAELLEPDQPDQAVAVLERAISVDPINEELYQRLMRIHGRHNRPEDVRRLLRILSERLLETGESEPSDATRRVAMRQLHLDRPQRFSAGHVPHEDVVDAELGRVGRDEA